MPWECAIRVVILRITGRSNLSDISKGIVYNDFNDSYDRGDEISDMIHSLIMVIGGLRRISYNMRTSVDELTDSAHTVDKASQDISKEMNETAGAIEEVSNVQQNQEQEDVLPQIDKDTVEKHQLRLKISVFCILMMCVV